MKNDEARIHAVCRYIEEHADGALSLGALAGIAGMSVSHFARAFKSVLGVTPKRYAAAHRLERFKTELRTAPSVDDSIYGAGYGSASRAYENAARSLGMTPAQYRRAGEGVSITYATLETPAGLLLIGATDRGLCFVEFGDARSALVERLTREYPRADVREMGEPAHPHFDLWLEHLRAAIAGDGSAEALPLDIRATAFQMRVWKHLQTIPYGHVQSYTEVARAIGAPASARAVARACASNHLAFVIPCHRVIRESGDLAGYRWGLERKRALLDHERARATLRGESASASRLPRR